MTRRRLIFMGSPGFAIPALDRLADEHDVLAVYTQPPRRSGRGMKETPQPLAAHATSRGIPAYHPVSLKAEADQAQLARFDADAFIVVAYGLLLPRAVLDLPRCGCINGHASLLPRWRGAAPIQRAIAAGDQTSGMSAMLMEEGLDTGPVLATKSCDISHDDTAGDLHDRLAALNADILSEVVADLPDILDRQTPQDDSLATYALKISPAEAELDWHQPAIDLDRHIRAFAPVPGAWFEGPKGRIRVRRAGLDTAGGETALPANGTIGAGRYLGLNNEGGMRIGTGDGVLVIHELQPAGGKAMPARAFLNGHPIAIGDMVGTAS